MATRLGAFVAITCMICGSFGVVFIPAVTRHVGRLCPDFVCFWSAAELTTRGISPYDPVAQGIIQKKYGWEKDRQGAGVLNFLPYYYPPWFVLVFIPLVPLGMEIAKTVWVIINIQLLLASGYLMGGLSSMPRPTSLLAASCFAFSLFAIPLGQTSIVVLFLIVVLWGQLRSGWDVGAGFILACALVKPQVTLVLVGLALVRASQLGRWRIVWSFALTMALLLLATALLNPRLLLQFVLATRNNPPPTEYFPWLGTSWLALLKSCRLQPAWIWGLHAAAALAVALVLHREIKHGRRWDDLLAVSLLAPYFLFPYCRGYDFPTLLPVVLLLEQRRKFPSLIFYTIFPYIHIYFLGRGILPWLPNMPAQEVTLIWVPVTLAFLWFSQTRDDQPGLFQRGTPGR